MRETYRSGGNTTHVESDSASGVEELGGVVGETVGDHFESSGLVLCGCVDVGK